MASSSVIPKVRVIEDAVYGTKINPDGHATAVKELKETCKILNTYLTGNKWLAGNSMTFADIHMFTSLAPAFQLTLDAGFRKAMTALTEWFEKVSRLPVVVARVGYIKPCAKALAPVKK